MPKSLKNQEKRKPDQQLQQSEKTELVKLTPKQELFCLLYMTYRGNGVRAYADAYDIRLIDKASYNVCASGASENLRKPNIIGYLSTLKQKAEVTEEQVVAEHNFLIMQDVDYKAKIAAIRLRRDIEGKTPKDPTTQNNIFIATNKTPEQIEKDFMDYLLNKPKEVNK